jgi:hypothetical protein
MKDSPLLQHAISGQVTASGIMWIGIGEEEQVNIPWETISQYRADRTRSNLILLYQESGVFVPFPNHLFANDEDWQQFCQMIHQDIPEKKDRRTQILFAIVSVFVIAIGIINIVALIPK